MRRHEHRAMKKRKGFSVRKITFEFRWRDGDRRDETVEFFVSF